MLHRESYIERKVTGHATANGWRSYKWSSPNNRGVPDRLYFKAARAIIIEFKAPGKRPTKLQLATHRKLEDQGFHVHVIDDIEAGKRLFA